MNNYSDLKYFTEFQQKSCTEIIEKYNKNQADISGSSIDEIIFNYFMPTYSCILRNDVDNAKTWKDKMEYALKGKDISLSQNSQYDIVTNFLDAHISRLKFEFYEALNHISEGYNEAKNTNNIHFCIRFMFLRGWLYSYLGHSELAEAEFLEAEKVIKENHIDKESDPFAVDIISAARCFIKNEEENESWNKWAKFFYYEMLVNDGRMKLDLVDTVTSVQGRYSYLDRIEQLIINKITDRDTEWQELYGKLYPNQKLYCELLTNKELTLNDINFDTLILFGKQLDKYVMENKISDLQKKSLLETFDKFIRNLNFQADFKNYESFVRLWLSERKGTYSEYLKYCGSNNVYSPFIEKDLKIEADHALSKCVSNIELILNINDGNGSRFLSPEEELNLRVFVYQYVKDDDNANKIASIINNTDLKSIQFSRELFFYEYENEKLFPKRDRRSLKDSAVIKSVLVRKYVDEPQSGIEEQLHKLGEEAISFRELELELLEAKLCSFDDSSDEKQSDSLGKWNVVKDNKKGVCDVWHLKKKIGEKVVEKDLLIFGEKGKWDSDYRGNPCGYWKKEGDDKVILSPLSYLDENLSLGKNVDCILVLLSGVYLINPETFFAKINKEDFIAISFKTIIERVNNYGDLFIPAKDGGENDIRKGYIVDIDNKIDEGDIINILTMYFKLKNKVDGNDNNVEKEYKNFGPVRFIRELIDRIKNEIGGLPNEVKYDLYIKIIDCVFTIKYKYNEDNSRELYITLERGKSGNNLEKGDYDVLIENNGFKLNFIDKNYFHEIKVLFGEKTNYKLDESYIRETAKSLYKGKVDECFLISPDDLAILLKDPIKKYAERTAKVAIMMRNISHNLGSHVMSYLKQKLSSVNDIIRNNVLADLVTIENDSQSIKQNLDSVVKSFPDMNEMQGITLPFLVGLGRFISYLQERQDFIASHAIDFPPVSSVINFKDHIYDELNPDKRYKRHPDRKNALMPYNILLEYIAFSEGLYRDHTKENNPNDIVIKFKDFDGEPVDKEDFSLDHYGKKELLESARKALDEMRGYDFSIPGGVVGRHAIFSIVENTIRNAAKHGKRPEGTTLDLSFDIYDDKSIVNASTDDNLELPDELPLKDVFSKFYKTATDGQALYYVTLTDNLETDYETLKKIRKAISDEYIDENGFMRDQYKGFKEMRVCSAWLRGLGNEYNPMEYNHKIKKLYNEHDSTWSKNENNPAPALYVRLSNKNLQFIFCVKKPQNVLLLSDRFKDRKLDTINNLIGNYWNGTTVEEFIKGKDYKDYYCILLEDSSQYDIVRSKSNMRLLRLDDIKGFGCDDLFEKIDNLTKDEMEKIFTIMLKKLSGYEEGDKITILDAKAKENYKNKGGNVSEGLLVFTDNYGKYMYKSHYETGGAFNEFKKYCRSEKRNNNYNYNFVESVTGSNSTDRLVRCEKIDENWFYKHLHAMKTKVAIIDERLSDKVLFGLYHNNNNKDFVKDICDLSKIDNDVRQYCKEKTAAIYADKNIYMFNVIRSNDEKKFVLYGFIDSDDSDVNKSKFNGYCGRLAVIKFENDNCLIEKTESGKIFFSSHCFDILSIHQGLMDKFYDVFNIKDDLNAKENLAKSLYELFNDKDRIINIEKHYFLPGMSIHSGRSKPSEADMPQRLPFIQYATLENAVFDCKFTLTELLDSAYYESVYNIY